MTVLEKIGALFARKDPASFAALSAEVAAEGGDEAPAQAETPAKPKSVGSLVTELKVDTTAFDAALKAAADKARNLLVNGFTQNAKAFVGGLLAAEKVAPADTAKLTQLYVAHALADVENPVTVGAGEEAVTYSRLDHFTSELNARGKRNVSGEFIAADGSNVPAELKGFKILQTASTPEDEKAAKAAKHKDEMLATLGEKPAK
jgi:hypothetical protein